MEKISRPAGLKKDRLNRPVRNPRPDRTGRDRPVAGTGCISDLVKPRISSAASPLPLHSLTPPSLHSQSLECLLRLGIRENFKLFLVFLF